MTTCPRCEGPTRPIPDGHACDACGWEWVTGADGDPGPAPTEMIDVLTDGNAIKVYGGYCSPGFDRANPPWRRKGDS